MQLFTSEPSTITEHAPQLPVSQPMWLPVRSRSSRMKWISSFRASTSRSYVVPLIVTAIDRTSGSFLLHVLSSSRCWPGRLRARRAPRRDARGTRLEACTSDGGSRSAARDGRAHRICVGRGGLSTTGTASTQPSAIVTLPFTDAAALDDARALDAERDGREAVAAAGRDRDPGQQLARRDRGQVDAEEELGRGDGALAARVRRS